MDFLKSVGAILVLLSGICLGAFLNRAAEHRLVQIEAFVHLLGFLRMQVECFALPIGEILARTDPRILFECGWHPNAPPRSLSELWEQVRILDGESERILFQWSASFGRGYREEEVRISDGAEKQLKKRAESLRHGLEGKRRVNLTLCVAGATAFVILLV